MKSYIVLLAFLATVILVNASKRHHHNKFSSSEHSGKCPRRKFCGKGKECRLNSQGQPQCFCIEKCPDSGHGTSICGSDGRFYPSHCHLNRYNCISGESVSIDSHGTTCGSSGKLSNHPLCSPEEFEILKDNLLLYNHEHLRSLDKEPNGKDYLLSLMFSHFDQNNNGGLDYAELQNVMAEDEMEKLAPPGCSLTHLFQFEDADGNDIIDLNEFYVAFNKLYTVSLISLDKAVEVTHITAQVNDNVELKCDVTGIPPMRFIWKRYEVDLSTQDDHQIRVFSDGTLYLSNIQLLHSGNYTCHGERNSHVVQTHVLTVQAPPDVHVSPHIIMKKPGTNVTMFCRVTGGEPAPTVQWLKNDDPIIPDDSNNKYIIAKNNVALTILDVYFSDTGAYMCEAKNSAGRRIDITSLVVVAGSTQGEDQDSLHEDSKDEVNGFFVFHEKGISIYDPNDCRLMHQIQATDIIPGTQDYVCLNEQVPECIWGTSIKVSTSYVYVTQPTLDRILIISISQMVVVDVVTTDRYPVELSYLTHLDQVWVQCWRSVENRGEKTLQVIRDAKEKKKHHTVHPEPINSHFDVVENLFLPANTKSSSQFHYGYVTHKNNRGFYKLDLIALRYVKSIDLTLWNCVPETVQFSGLYGMIIIECREPVTGRQTGEIVFDALTDSVIHYKGDRFGKPYLSPDSRKLVTVSHDTTGTTLLVQRLTANGLQFSFDVKTSLNISLVAFYPSRTSHTYDLFASSVDKLDVLFVDLETGKVEMVTGFIHSSIPKSKLSTSLFPWNKPEERPISSQSLFSNYLVTRSQESVYIINGNTHTVNCQIGGLVAPSLILWI
ncbi:unnamed protein product [Allacma fusca]|uniref:Follistatin-related protein 5 n=1 Tax=Allacma fusca TaxID=39272 RepID=A0A8J2LHA8_9HEXA|nr:unnamed protein product [Allacma fusca]